MIPIIDVLGIIVFIVSTCIPIPQAYRIWKDKAARDVSMGMITLASSSQLLWITYGWLQHDLYLWAASIPALFINLFLLHVYLKYREGEAMSGLQYDQLPEKCLKCSWLKKNEQDIRLSYCPLMKCMEDMGQY